MDKNFIGKTKWIHIEIKGRDLFYTAKNIISITNTHITFIDKFEKEYTYRLSDVIETQPIQQQGT